ncbi:MAG: hypothetical protein DRP50_01180 [Thermotoga sp.]|nr:MAG: hypothetical protein DRP50_01180 [Thermotoga sp.]
MEVLTVRKEGKFRFLILIVILGVAITISSLVFAAQKEVTLIIFARGYTFNQDAPWKLAEQELQRRHPDIKFNFVEEGFGWSELRSKFLTAASGGHPPDVAQVDIIWLGEYVKGGLLLDLTDKALRWPEWMDVVKTFRDAAKWDGKIYGSWLNTDVRVLAYNKKLFREAGLDPNKPPKDWNEFLEYAKRISNPPKYYGLGFPAMKEEATAHRFFALLYSAGGKILNDSMTKAEFNSEAGVKALQLLVDMVKSGATPKSIVSGSYSDIDKGLYRDKFAMTFMTKTIGLARDIIPDFTMDKYMKNFGVAPIPKAPGGKWSTMSGGYLLCVPTKAKHPDLAWELISIATSADVQLKYTVARGYVPTHYSLMHRTDEYKKLDPYFDVILGQLPYAHFRPSLPQYTEISAAIQDAIQKAVLGVASPKKALDEAAERVNNLLKGS